MSHTTSLNWKRVLPILGLAALASLALPHAVAAEGKPRAVRVAAQDAPYALVRGQSGSFNISGGSDDWDDVRAAQRSVKGEFLWFRDGGRSYVIQDPETLRRARAAWARLDRLGARMDAQGREMDKHGKKMDALGREMDHAARPADLPNERTMREVDDGPAARQSRASMENIGKQMEAASQPMEQLGKRMGELGKEMERESKAADKTVRALIHDAHARGLAKAVPAAG